MKKYIFQLMLGAIALFFSSCHSTSVPLSDLYEENKASDQELLSYTSSCKMFETDEMYYLVDDGYVYVSNKEQNEWVILCNKPECEHRNAENIKDCNAFVNYDMKIYLYQNNIYYTTGAIIMSMNLDGSGHKELLNASDKTADFGGQYSYAAEFYNGKAYLIEALHEQRGEQGWCVTVKEVCLEDRSVRKLFEHTYPNESLYVYFNCCGEVPCFSVMIADIKTLETMEYVYYWSKNNQEFLEWNVDMGGFYQDGWFGFTEERIVKRKYGSDIEEELLPVVPQAGNALTVRGPYMLLRSVNKGQVTLDIYDLDGKMLNQIKTEYQNMNVIGVGSERIYFSVEDIYWKEGESTDESEQKSINYVIYLNRSEIGAERLVFHKE